MYCNYIKMIITGIVLKNLNFCHHLLTQKVDVLKKVYAVVFPCNKSI